jgi:hypothetical protein
MLIRRGLALLGSLALGGTLLGAAGCGGGLSTGEHVFYWVAIEATKPEASCYSDKKIPDSIKDDITTVRGRATFVLYVTGDDVAQLDTGSSVLVGTPTDTGFTFTGDTVDVESPPGTKVLDADRDGVPDSTDMMIDADKDGVEDNNDQLVDTDMDLDDERVSLGGQSQDDLVDVDTAGDDDRFSVTPSGIKFTSTSSITIDVIVDGTAISGTVTNVASKKCEGLACPKEYATSCTRTSAFTGVQIEQTEVHVAAESGTKTPD